MHRAAKDSEHGQRPFRSRPTSLWRVVLAAACPQSSWAVSGSRHSKWAQEVDMGGGTGEEVSRFAGPYQYLQPSVFTEDSKNLSRWL